MTLDELVATRVMGYFWSRKWGAWAYDGGGMLPIEAIELIEHFHPSTDMNDALAALEKAINGFSWSLYSTANLHHSGVAFRVFCDREPASFGDAPTAPLAMTLCALRAAGVSEDEIKDAMEETK